MKGLNEAPPFKSKICNKPSSLYPPIKMLEVTEIPYLFTRKGFSFNFHVVWNEECVKFVYSTPVKLCVDSASLLIG